MSRSLVVLVLVALATFKSVECNTDTLCQCNTTNMWLDVVAVIDNSEGMGDDGRTQVANNLINVFRPTSVGTGEQKSVRLAVVTVTDQATLQYDLDHFKSTVQMMQEIGDLLKQPGSGQRVNLRDGLFAAQSVLRTTRGNGYRANYQQVLLVYASNFGANETDPRPLAQEIKESGITIVATSVAMNPLQVLGDIASPGYNFNTTDHALDGDVTGALCKSNCFCPQSWTQYHYVFGNPLSYKYGSCLIATYTNSSWKASKFLCQNIHEGGFLATEFSYRRNEFNYELVKQTFRKPLAYNIGLSYVNGQYMWEQGTSRDKRKMGQFDYTAWNDGFPLDNPSNKMCVANTLVGNDYGWSNVDCYNEVRPSVCEIKSCDTENYCA